MGVFYKNSNGAVTDIFGNQTQYTTLPSPNESFVGRVCQYIGATTSAFTNGYFYKCQSDGSGGYEWVNVNVQEGGSGQSIQYETMPTAELSRAGDIIQYVGTDTNDYKNGYFYKCVEKSGQYVWESITTQASDKTKVTHFEVMPAASADYFGETVQYIGADTENYTHNYFYECHLDNTGAYYWRNTPVQGDSYWRGTTARFNAEKDNIPIGTIIYITDTNKNEDPYAQYTFADSTPEQMALMLAAHDRGDINIYDYWKVGDRKMIHMGAISAGWDNGEGEGTEAKNVALVIYDTVYGDNNIHFVIRLGWRSYSGYMNPTDTATTGWKDCSRRKWCNGVLYDALPNGYKTLFKPFTVKTSNYTQTALEITTDKFALLSGYEWGGRDGSWGSDFNNPEKGVLSRMHFFTDDPELNKTWDYKARYLQCFNEWFRSPKSDTKFFNYLGGSDTATHKFYVNPFGCI